MQLPKRTGLLIVVLLAIVAVVAITLIRPTPATAPVAPPTATPAPTAVPTATPEAPAEDEAEASPAAIADAAPTVAETTAAADVTEPALRTFVVDPAQSEARFIVDELLFGNPNTVVGVTADVAATLTVNLDDPAQTVLEPVRVDARTLVTDNRFRNRSINRLILQANQDAYQYITFTVSAVEGLPDTAAVNAPMVLQVTGNLQIRDIVQPVTFAVTVTAQSESELSGLAVGTVQRADFDLNIPNVDGVADVSEDVRLELEFVALAEE